MGTALWEDGHTLVLSQMVPHSRKHLVIIDMREKLWEKGIPIPTLAS
jgi:hypothetical protein